MQLAKAFFDVGLFSNQAAAHHSFWSERIALPFDHSLKLGGGVLQHRFQVGSAVLKLNDARDPLPTARGPIRELLVAHPDCQQVESLQDPDGNRITRVPSGHDDIHGLAVRLAVADPARSADFYQRALGCKLISPARLQAGEAILLLEQADSPAEQEQPLAAIGLRYLTLQVFDCDAAHAAALAAGASNGRDPVTLGSTARIAFIRDPDGTWIELSERASVTGKAV
ncbi:VOC family protein [Halopseudomonas salegens]|uniref:Catechol 2,3-dioxygenase n=1 Tax=Halopseudomonas salegens TaxID=1434072 RepID=A0A1H2G9U4_9GAMM|nr:VOC family protein [Halopseudomonas salegens]SDU16506.1 Catechol 2,3-dioxygenase [Halopseudomonas salegens]